MTQRIHANAIEGLPSGSAADTTYDNTTSGLAAGDVQAALDELAATPPPVSLVPWTSTAAGDPVFLWDDDDNLMMIEES